MQKSLLFFIFLCTLSSVITAQPEDDEWFYGFKAGINNNRIEGIGTTIIPAVFAENSYTVETLDRRGFVGGLFLYHRFRKSRLAIQPEILFADGGGTFQYTDVNELDYTLGFNYQFLSLGAVMKIHPMGGFHFAAGPQVAFNVARDRLTYVSNMPELGPDLQIQQSLREVLRGGNDIGILLGAGYDFNFGLSVEGRYRIGLRDGVETMANGFNFIETDNLSSGWQVTLGWLIQFPDL